MCVFAGFVEVRIYLHIFYIYMIKEKGFNFKRQFKCSKRSVWLDVIFKNVRVYRSIDPRNNYIVCLFLESVGKIEGLIIITITNELFSAGR